MYNQTKLQISLAWQKYSMMSKLGLTLKNSGYTRIFSCPERYAFPSPQKIPAVIHEQHVFLLYLTITDVSY